MQSDLEASRFTRSKIERRSAFSSIRSPHIYSLAKKLGCFALVADKGSRGGKTRGGKNMSKGAMKLNPQRVSYHVNDGVQLVGDAWGASDAAPVLLLHGVGQSRHVWRGTAR